MGCKSEEQLGVDDPVDGLLAVEHGAEDEVDGGGPDVGLLDQPVHEVVVVLLEVEGVPPEYVAGVEVGQELQAPPVEGVDVGVADLSVEGFVAEEQVDAEDVLAGLGVLVLLGVVLPVVLLEGVLEGAAHVHHLHRHPHLLLVLICLKPGVPLLKSVFRSIFLTFFEETTLVSRRSLRAIFFFEGVTTMRSHSLGSWESIQGGISRKKV